jgi:soluble lytic murein transglycosylase
MRVGLREQARWELQDVAAGIAADPGRLFWLAQFATDRGEPQLGVRFAVEARQATGQPLHVQPKLLQRLIYPLPYADLIVANAQRRGVDPLLFAALVRQESTFNASARSSADARGLAQVVPPTGREIARALGRDDFEPDDLFRPIVSVEFGAYYLGTQLKAFEDRVYPALAAYNAGGGAANRWLRDFGGSDPDEFAERIPYAETSGYLRIVYENYRIYQRLYR